MTTEQHLPRFTGSGLSDAPAESGAPWNLHGVPSGRAPTVAVVVRRRRPLERSVLPGATSASHRVGAAHPAAEAERTPRIFVVPHERQLQSSHGGEICAQLGGPVVRAAKRRLRATSRPGEVVTIVPPKEVLPTQAGEASIADSWLPLPAADEYQVVLDSLAAIQTLLDQAAVARRLRFGTTRRFQ